MAESNPIDFIEKTVLLDFFQRHKTELSCINNPETFVSQLRDNRLILEEHYQKILHAKKIQKDLYEALDWFQMNKKKYIVCFWKCVFKEPIMEKYPTLKELQEELFEEGDLKVNSQLGRQNEVRPEVKIPVSVCDEEQPGSSSDVTQPRRQGTSSSSLSRKCDTWPVTCGNKKGHLYINELKNGSSKCILVGDKWKTPSEFQHLEGKKNCKNWKTSIRHRKKTLLHYIQNGRIVTRCEEPRRRVRKAK